MKRVRWTAAVLAVVVAAGGLLSAVPSAEAGTGTADRLTAYHRQQLTWRGCQLGSDDADGQALDAAGARCAALTVPLDYRRPGGRRITVAVTRIAATDPRRIGALVFNLGGPANPVLGSMPLAREAMGEAGARFDLIGMDPRFAGRSTPLDCGWPGSWMPRSAGADRDSFNRATALARDLARRCARRHGDLLPHASTANTARDLDVLRAALGEQKLSYVGYSQGSYLGAVYTQLFPARAGRIVLDSAIDPARPGTPVLRESAPPREAALREWAAWAARHDGRYHLGGTAAHVLSAIGRVYTAAAREPLRVGRYRADDTLVPGLLLGPLADDTEESNDELAATVRVLLDAADHGRAEATEALDLALTNLLTGAGSAVRSVQTATLCADAAVSRDVGWYWRDIEAHRAAEPLFGPLGRTITPCAFWSGRPAQPPVRVGNAVPALVVQAAGDIDATLDHGRAMHRALTGSRMVTLDGARTHGVYLFRRAACVDDAVNAYLTTGVLPAADLTCAGTDPARHDGS